MLVLFETASGFALFKLKKGLQLSEARFDELFASETTANETIALKGFHKFADTTEGLAATTAIVESKLPKSLEAFLHDNIVARDIKEELAVAEPKLGQLIKEKFKITCVNDAQIFELMRGIRRQLHALISDLNETDMNHMALGLAHSFSRYKLKFSPDKVDTMIVQAISLLDDLDKELNTYTMRVREWYGWHFPEMGKMLAQNLHYVRTVLAVGDRKNFPAADLSGILDEETETELKEVAELSMGSEITEQDVTSIKHLAEQVVSITQYREELHEYLKNRMHAIAPNLTIMVGEYVGARLIAHAGSLMNLAKHPASTVQILGAEKALFRALKTKKNTPKYGLIYHASLVSKSLPKNRGKMSRILAAKVSLVSRVDALGEDADALIATEYMEKVMRRFRLMEGHENIKANDVGGSTGPAVYEVSAPVKGYNDAADAAIPKKAKKQKTTKAAAEEENGGAPAAKRRAPEKEEKEEKEEKGEKEEQGEQRPKKKKAAAAVASGEETAAAEEPEKKKQKKKKTAEVAAENGGKGEAEAVAAVEEGEKKTKKKKKKTEKKKKAQAEE